MFTINRMLWLGMAFLITAIGAGCNENAGGKILRVDAEYDPAATPIAFGPVHEANPAVAQTFTILAASGKFEEFWIVLTDGESVDDGVVRITVRPTIAGVPDADESSSIIDPIDVDTTTLPATGVDQFTEFDVGNDPRREVLAGEGYAIVVEFVSRTGVDTAPIARVLGLPDNPYPDGTGSDGESGVGFVNNTDDYFFRTFVLQ